MKTKRLFGWLLTVMTGVMLSFAAGAENVEFVFYDEQTASMKKSVCVEYEALTEDMTTWEDGKWYVVYGNPHLNQRVKVSGDAYLILKDGCELRAFGGIDVPKGSSLTIFSESEGEYGKGKLVADASNEYASAGIGGSDGSSGDITIHGGIVTAYGTTGGFNIIGNVMEYGGAGIGCGGGNGTDCGNITICGGAVTAIGGTSAACIGCSGKNDGTGTVTICGGNVSAVNGGCGIGSADGGWNGTIRLLGGSLKADGDMCFVRNAQNSRGRLIVREDIRYMRQDEDTPITREEGQTWDEVFDNVRSYYTTTEPEEPEIVQQYGSRDVTYLSYDGSAGKLARSEHKGCTVMTKDMDRLETGWYVLWDKLKFEGIVEFCGDVHLILADGSSLEADGYNVSGTFNLYAQSEGWRKGRFSSTGAIEYQAGVSCCNAAVNIHGGRLAVTGGHSAAAIGGCFRNITGGNVRIYGGYIQAFGGYNGAGIGGGEGGAGCDVEIYGGDVYAYGGHYGSGIGEGGETTMTPDGELRIREGMSVVNLDEGWLIDRRQANGVHTVRIYDPGVPPERETVYFTAYHNGTFEKWESKTYYTPYPENHVMGDAWYVIDGERTFDDVLNVRDSAKLILQDGCHMTAKTGIHVPHGSSLTIYAGENGTGRLEAYGDVVNAGIGGAFDENGGDIYIHGGHIEAVGGETGGAGIGSGYYDVGCDYDYIDWVYDLYDSGAAGKIEIYGGNILATGGYNAAGIGGGYGCHGGAVSVYGGVAIVRGGSLSGMVYEDNADGIGNGWFDVLDEDDQTVLMSDEVKGGKIYFYGGAVLEGGKLIHPEHIFSDSYTDNGDGTHRRDCLICDVTVSEKHTVTDGECVCGAKEFVIDENDVLTRYNGDSAVVHIPDGVKSVGEHVFHGNKTLGEVYIPSSVETIAPFAFFQSGLTAVHFASDTRLTTIGALAFTESKLTSFTVPRSVKTIGDSAVGGMKTMTELYFEEGAQVESIDDWAFNNDALTVIDIPATVKSIGRSAFGTMPLTSVTVHRTKEEDIPQLAADAFSEKTYADAVLHVPAGTMEIYENHAVFGKFAHIDELSADVLPSLDVSVEGGAYTVTVENAAKGLVIAAVYDEGGRMTGVKVFDIENGDEMTGTVADGGRVRAFLVSDTLTPLCEAATAENGETRR